MEKPKEKKYLTFRYLKEIEESDLDISTVEKILGKDAYEDPGFERLFFPLNKDYGYETETQRISIELLEKTIAKLKKSGANYMEIMHHTDHNGYVFYGIEVRKSTPEEIENEKRNDIARERIEKRMEELKKEFNELDKQRQKL